MSTENGVPHYYAWKQAWERSVYDEQRLGLLHGGLSMAQHLYHYGNCFGSRCRDDIAMVETYLDIALGENEYGHVLAYKALHMLCEQVFNPGERIGWERYRGEGEIAEKTAILLNSMYHRRNEAHIQHELKRHRKEKIATFLEHWILYILKPYRESHEVSIVHPAELIPAIYIVDGFENLVYPYRRWGVAPDEQILDAIKYFAVNEEYVEQLSVFMEKDIEHLHERPIDVQEALCRGSRMARVWYELKAVRDVILNQRELLNIQKQIQDLERQKEQR